MNDDRLTMLRCDVAFAIGASCGPYFPGLDFKHLLIDADAALSVITDPRNREAVINLMGGKFFSGSSHPGGVQSKYVFETPYEEAKPA